MKTDKSHDEDKPLSGLLREWKVTTPLPPRFQDSVWRRIGSEQEMRSTLWAGLIGWLENVLPRPQVALCYVTALFLIGMAVGMWTGERAGRRMETELGSRYVQSVDPYQPIALNR